MSSPTPGVPSPATVPGSVSVPAPAGSGAPPPPLPPPSLGALPAHAASSSSSAAPSGASSAPAASSASTPVPASPSRLTTFLNNAGWLLEKGGQVCKKIGKGFLRGCSAVAGPSMEAGSWIGKKMAVAGYYALAIAVGIPSAFIGGLIGLPLGLIGYGGEEGGGWAGMREGAVFAQKFSRLVCTIPIVACSSCSACGEALWEFAKTGDKSKFSEVFGRLLLQIRQNEILPLTMDESDAEERKEIIRGVEQLREDGDRQLEVLATSTRPPDEARSVASAPPANQVSASPSPAPAPSAPPAPAAVDDDSDDSDDDVDPAERFDTPISSPGSSRRGSLDAGPAAIGPGSPDNFGALRPPPRQMPPPPPPPGSRRSRFSIDDDERTPE